jgi:hypothetical protein
MICATARPRFDPDVAEFLTAMPADACDRDADGLKYEPSIEALVEILEREERASQAQSANKV